MDIVIRRPTTKATFVDVVIPDFESPIDERRWLMSCLTSAISARGTSLFADSDTLVYVDGEEKYVVGRNTNITHIVDELLPEEVSEERAYGDGHAQ